MRLYRKIYTDTKSSNKNNKMSEELKERLSANGILWGGLGSNLAAYGILKLQDDTTEEGKKNYKKLVEALKKDGHLDENTITLGFGGASSSGYSDSRDKIKMGGEDASILSHEAGHRHFMKDPKGEAKWLGKNAHKLYNFSKYGHLPAAALAGITTGTMAKYKGDNDKDYKEGALSKYSGAIAGTAVGAPMLISEVAASNWGKKQLEKQFDKKTVRKMMGKQRLANSTYASTLAISAGVGQLMHHHAKHDKAVDFKKRNEDKKK